MTPDHSHHDQGTPPGTTGQGSFWSSRAFLVFVGFAAIALVLLWKEHSAHILGVIPYLFLLACPLMHVFMHRGHGGHGTHRRHERGGRDATETDGGAP